MVEPNETGNGFEFVSKIVGEAVPQEYISVSKRASNRCSGPGVVAGFPIVDLKVTLVDGDHHEVDSSPFAFESAARAALREALRDGQSVLIEPIMKVEVVTRKTIPAS